MKYRIRLWDFDGTLADTGRDVWNSIQYAAKKCGGEIDRDYMKKDSNLGKPLAEIFEKVMPYPGMTSSRTYFTAPCVLSSG